MTDYKSGKSPRSLTVYRRLNSFAFEGQDFAQTGTTLQPLPTAQVQINLTMTVFYIDP